MRAFPKSLAFAAGLVSALGFAPLELWPLTMLCVAVWMAIVADAPTIRSALARGYLFGLGHFIVGLNWIAGAFRYQETMPVWLGWVAVVVLSIYIAVYPAVAAGLAWRWGRPRGTVYALIFAAAWMVSEYLRAELFTGFAWNPLGVALLPIMASGVAKVIGTYGLSGCVVLVAGALVHQRRFIAFPAIGTGLLAVGWMTIGIAGDPGRTNRVIRVVQPNIGQATKNDPAYETTNWTRLAALTGPPTATPRLILWPEAAVPYYLEEESWARDKIARLLGPNDAIMTGGDALVWNRKGDVIAARNSLFVMGADGEVSGRYDKAHLVPYGEYLPMRPLLSAIGLSRLVPGDLDFRAGPGPQSFAIPGFGKVGVQICYEIIFSGEVVDAAHRPALLFNPSNDAWFGTWGPPQHLAQARLRALEEGVPIVRATPTGISAVIDSNGRMPVALPLGKAGYIQTTLPAAASPTPFARFGNALPAVFALTLIGFGVALSRRRR